MKISTSYPPPKGGGFTDPLSGTLNVQKIDSDNLKADLRNASILKNNRVVFNLCGNKYRIVVLMDYVRHGMLIRFVGTHKEYDEIEDIEHI